MSARDELSAVVADSFFHDSYYGDSLRSGRTQHTLTDAILDAGFSKPTNEQTAAVAAMAGITEAMDTMFRGQATQQETLNQIAKTLGAYEMGRI